MNERDVTRNIRLYKWYMTFREPILWGPVLISCITHLGRMKLPEIYFMESIVLIGMIFLQVPTGALADLVGRKKTVIVGSLLYALSAIGFAIASSPLGMWSANITWMVGASLCSGADSAFLYDSLKSVGRETEYKKVDGAAAGNQLVITALGCLTAGYLAQFSLRLPLLLSIPGVLVSAILPFFFKEPPMMREFNAKEQMGIMKVSALFVANHKEVKWVIGFTTLIGVSSKIWFFTYNPYFELVKLHLRYYGVVFFAMNLAAWYFSSYAHLVSKKIKEKSAMILMVVLIGVPIIIMGSYVSVLSIGMVFLQNIVRGFMRPFLGEFLNRHLDSENRATVLSVQSAVSSFAQFVALGCFGLLLGSWGLPFCLQILGVAVLLLGGVAVLTYNKVFG